MTARYIMTGVQTTEWLQKPEAQTSGFALLFVLQCSDNGIHFFADVWLKPR